ncbi:NAD(P)-binding domain-containing protein [Saccharothrix violaceirubra]|uniref:Pyrroline-5-carboxylate reductase catalytic N-terminal domain-containing protein n=1 Tax=Saccharothrix violaceirubra TaxID=413306 RepID=A0A7W7WWT1_9PSEU|nr:NAD(P)-binding domain-containing protein [Saccharothrix violaceirubra]MBB4966680.1 hypothetical protein [Saccharothrix violaceirubra]
MRIGVLGTGGVAAALGARWVAAGHEVVIGGRSVERARALAVRLGASAGGSLADARSHGDVLLVAVPAAVAVEVLGHVPGRVVVDCTNSVVPGRFVLDRVGQARSLGASGGDVVKAFNLHHVSTWDIPAPVYGGVPLGVPICGDSSRALDLVAELVRAVGCVPVLAGGLERAELLEATAAFAIGLWFGGHDVRALFPTS